MKPFALVLALALLGVPQDTSPRFAAIDLVVDSGAQPLAAWQIELTAQAGTIRIAGVEGGERAPFADPPWYDPAALRDERVIVAAFSTAAAGELPTGSTRVARVHVQIMGAAEPHFVTRLMAAATVGGHEIAAQTTAVQARRQ